MFVCVAQRTRAQQIVPCTVCQLMSAVQAEDVFKVGEVEIAQVTIVGVIRSTDKSTINIQYKVDDMTAAPMDVKQWIDTENNRSLVAFSVRVLEDMNEVTSHMLEVVNAHVQQSKPQKTMGGGGGMNVMPSMSSIGSTGSYSGAGMMLVNVSLSVNQNQVLSLIKSCHEPQGISMQDLKQKLSSMSVTVIRQIVDFLSNEGHIFSTIDEDHFRSTMKSNYLFLSDCLNKPISYLHIYILGV
ncbi:replication protein A 32 kDa subunit-like [Sinocyclocheilus anshuiensis]|uniref:replication protein A 32 kDa subunit-like n=1 Tax=Sinocyclocheilus anshuiensis TaxID=1608454 RepID=UPI0007BA6ADF|nr:PREDICTED: replication protein A 32 kDa subunit-like [Sinocyclocheilus anshuiensis]